MPEVNKEVIRKWVDALRSGKYIQTQNFLCAEGCHCCLGVLCELAAEEGVCEIYENQYGDKTYDGDIETLPVNVREWAGLESYDPVSLHKPWNEHEEDWDDEVCYSTLNDKYKWDFNQIADHIEKQYLTEETSH